MNHTNTGRGGCPGCWGEREEKLNFDASTVERYRKNYHLGTEIDASHVKRHWELEARLSRELLASTPDNRWSVFSACYSTLFQELPWLNSIPGPTPSQFVPWLRLVPAKSRIFEVGSGRGDLLKFLAAHGHSCVATEITPERGQKHVEPSEQIAWRTTDGVHLDRFEQHDSYDVVLSNQVIEHFHPDDLATHFRSVRTILVAGGRYIFDTPHRGTGPHDLSRIFNLATAQCMHLKEYSFLELSKFLRDAGFSHIEAIYAKGRLGPFHGRFLLGYYCFWDWFFERIALPPASERRVRRLLRFAGLPGNIWLSATK